MTREEILTLPVGNNLDAIVAQQVLGCQIRKRNGLALCGCTDHEHGQAHWDEPRSGLLEDYSADIAAAWQLVERLRLQWVAGEDKDGIFFAFQNPETQSCEWEAGADTLPLAICRAALLATLKPE